MSTVYWMRNSFAIVKPNNNHVNLHEQFVLVIVVHPLSTYLTWSGIVATHRY